jgi:hypothetical protein
LIGFSDQLHKPHSGIPAGLGKNLLIPGGFSFIMREILPKGGDPLVSLALFHSIEILKQRRPESLGKALDSEAGQGLG